MNACLLLCDCCHGEQNGSDFSVFVTVTIGVGSTPPWITGILFLHVNGKTVYSDFDVAETA